MAEQANKRYCGGFLPNQYGGKDHAVIIRSDGAEAVSLPLRLDIANHSPTGFCWGYGGSGPTQLALAILADAVSDEVAARFSVDFRRAFIERLDMNVGFEISEKQVVDWALEALAAEASR